MDLRPSARRPGGRLPRPRRRAGAGAGRGAALTRWAAPPLGFQRSPGLPALIVGLHLCLALVFSAAVPIWESYDETGHYPYVRYLARHAAFPPIGGVLTDWFDEAHQPPLYYVLAAALTALQGGQDELAPRINEFAWAGTGVGGYNIALHGPQEALPYRQGILAFRLARLASVLLGTLGAVALVALGGEALGRRRRLGLAAGAAAALLPMFVFMGAVVNNDALLVLPVSLLILATLRLARSGRQRDFLLAGVLLGLALLTKHSAFALLPLPVAGALLVRRWRELLGTYAAAFVVSGWWYARNLLLHGQVFPDRAQANPFGTAQAPFVTEALGQSFTPAWFYTLFSNSFRSFWGYYGWGNVHADEGWIYGLLLLAVAGAIAGLLRRRLSPGLSPGLSLRRHPTLAVLGLAGLLLLVLPTYRALYFADPYLVPGRYLLPVSGAYLALATVGLGALLATRRHLAFALPALLLVLAVTAPFGPIARAYDRPPLLRGLPHGATPVHLVYGGQVELLGYRAVPDSVRPGESLELTLYWSPRRSLDREVAVGIRLLGRELVPYGGVDSYPANGTHPSTLWRAGEIFAETYAIRLMPEAPVPNLGRFSVRLHDWVGEDELPAADAQGRAVAPVFGRVKLAASVPRDHTLAHASGADFGDLIRLEGWELRPASQELVLALNWKALRSPAADYTVFIHLVGPDGRPVATFDGPPLEGEYPTGMWAPGEEVLDEHRFRVSPEVPPGRYRLVVGLYRPDTGERLPVAGDPSGALHLTELALEG